MTDKQILERANLLNKLSAEKLWKENKSLKVQLTLATEKMGRMEKEIEVFKKVMVKCGANEMMALDEMNRLRTLNKNLEESKCTRTENGAGR